MVADPSPFSFRATPLERLRRLAGAHELLRTLVVKDLRAHYRGSTLGLLWALVQPLLLMVVYTGIFVAIADLRVAHYPALLLAGLVPWTFLASTLHAATGAVADNAGLVKKLRFPRETLAASVVVANLLHLLLAMALLLAVLLLLGVGPRAAWLLLPLPLALLALFAAGLAFALAALGPVHRDVRFAVAAWTTLWFYLTPIVYPLSLVPERARPFLLLNPMAPLVGLFQAVLVGAPLPEAGALAWLAAVTAAAVWFGLRIFGRYDGRLADLL